MTRRQPTPNNVNRVLKGDTSLGTIRNRDTVRTDRAVITRTTGTTMPASIQTDTVEESLNQRRCRNCQEDVHVPDDRTGLIHTGGKYVCHRGVKYAKGDRVYVAERRLYY